MHFFLEYTFLFKHAKIYNYKFCRQACEDVKPEVYTYQISVAGYRRLARQPPTHFVAVLRENITLHEIYLHTFRSSYYFLLNIFFRKKIPFCRETVSSISWSDHSNVNKPLHTFHFSHIFVLRTRFTYFSQVVCSRLIAKQGNRYANA